MVSRVVAALLAGFLLIASLITVAQAKEHQLKIGIVRMNDILNRSEAGKRSKNILLASKKQKEEELKSKEQRLKKLRTELDSNIMLSKEARAAKQKELRAKVGTLRKELQQAQIDLQARERKLTEGIFTELKTVIKLIAKEDKFDFIMDEGAAQVILFSKYEFTDITENVLKRYNSLNR